MEKKQPALTPGTQSPRRSLIKVEGQNAILSTLKKAEIGDALILRLYNPSDILAQATLRLPFIPASIHLCGLDEQPRTASGAESAPVLETDGKITILIPPKKVITLRMIRA
jgi:alpha-mannosidase